MSLLLGAQIFEALGLAEEVVDRCFVGTASRVAGSTFELLAMDAFEIHERGYPSRDLVLVPGLPETGEYHWRDGGEAHINDPVGIASLQNAVRQKSQQSYDEYAANARKQVQAVTLRGLLEFDFDKAKAIPIEQVEPWHEIVKRFVTGAMSYGSISMESHSSLAIAMNRLGGKSNTGEGGEDAERSQVMPNGDTMRSAIKQIASGRRCQGACLEGNSSADSWLRQVLVLLPTICLMQMSSRSRWPRAQSLEKEENCPVTRCRSPLLRPVTLLPVSVSFHLHLITIFTRSRT